MADERKQMLGAWQRKYANGKLAPYGNPKGYEVACKHLLGLTTVEDWGCGRAWARRYFGKGTNYVGVDGTAGFADVVEDLRDRRSSPEGILMRHVLEHNEDWKAVLENALACFTERMSLALFTELSDELEREYGLVRWNPAIVTQRLPRSELLDMIHPFLVERLREGPETIFYLVKVRR